MTAGLLSLLTVTISGIGVVAVAAALPLGWYIVRRRTWRWLDGRLLATIGELRCDAVQGPLTVLPSSLLLSSVAVLTLADNRSQRYYALVRRRRQAGADWRRLAVLWHTGALWGDRR
ncbi:MAG: hypothetical protein AAGC71_04210 [Pseudomonadota bacterium]